MHLNSRPSSPPAPALEIFIYSKVHFPKLSSSLHLACLIKDAVIQLLQTHVTKYIT